MKVAIEGVMWSGARALTGGLTLLSFVLAAACSDGAGPDRTSLTTIQDSAGVEIVASEPAAAQAFQLDEPAVWVGEVEGDEPYLLSRVYGGALTDDGFIISNAGTMEVRRYTEDGAHVWSVGGQGQGPGEFADMARLTRYRGDSVVVWDRALQRATVVAEDGSGTRVIRVNRPGGSAIRYVIPLSDGSMIARAAGAAQTSRPPYGLFRSPIELGLISPEGQPVRPLFTLPGDDMYMMPMSGGGVAINNHPTGRIPDFTTSDDNLLIVEGTSYSVAVHGRDGALVRRLKVLAEPPLLTDELKAAALADFLGDDPSPAMRTEIGELFEQLDWPERVPATARVLSTSSGEIWVMKGPVPGTPSQEWMVFDGEGALIGELTLAPTEWILDVDIDRVLVVATDLLGVQRVGVRRLQIP